MSESTFVLTAAVSCLAPVDTLSSPLALLCFCRDASACCADVGVGLLWVGIGRDFDGQNDQDEA